LRPAEVDLLIGDPAKAKKQLQWEPSITFQELVELMVSSDLEAVGIVDPSKAVHPELATIRRVQFSQSMA
jgi:GDPmannose 4,6-dehydratase